MQWKAGRIVGPGIENGRPRVARVFDVAHDEIALVAATLA